MEEINNFINPKFYYAVVGASNDKHRAGFLLFDQFLKNNFKAIPINIDPVPVNSIQMQAAFENLKTARPFADAVVIVDASNQTIIQTLKDMRDTGVFRVWFFNVNLSEEAYSFCLKENFEVYKGENLLKLIEIH